MTSHTNRRNGFTLMELLIVIAIIALLSAVSLAALSTIRAKARQTAAISTLKNLYTTIELYAGDNYGQYPAEDEELASIQNVSVDDPTQLAFHLESLMRETESQEERNKTRYLLDLAPKVAHPFIEKNEQGALREIYFLYHINSELEYIEPGLGSIDTEKSPWGKPKVSIGFRRTEAPMISDIFLGPNWDDYKKKPVQTFWGNKFNVLFFDGHVETYRQDNFEWLEVIPFQ